MVTLIPKLEYVLMMEKVIVMTYKAGNPAAKYMEHKVQVGVFLLQLSLIGKEIEC